MVGVREDSSTQVRSFDDSLKTDKIKNNSSSYPIIHAFDEKHKLVSGPKQEFSIKAAPK